MILLYRHNSTPVLLEEMRQNGYTVHSSGGRVQSGPVHFQTLGYNNSPIQSVEGCDEAMLVLLQQALCAQAQKTESQPSLPVAMQMSNFMTIDAKLYSTKAMREFFYVWPTH